MLRTNYLGSVWCARAFLPGLVAGSHVVNVVSVAGTVAFGPAGLPRVWSMTAVGNVRSQAVMRRLGLVEHSRFAHPAVPPEHELSEHVAFWSPPGFRPPSA